jgi:hypothetical protein
LSHLLLLRSFAFRRKVLPSGQSAATRDDHGLSLIVRSLGLTSVCSEICCLKFDRGDDCQLYLGCLGSNPRHVLTIVHHRLRLLASPMRTTAARVMSLLVNREISRFPYKERPHMPSSPTTPGRAGTRDGLRSDVDGNLWCGRGMGTAELDGVFIYSPEGADRPHPLPERCANLCFGGAKRNRLFMAASKSLYSLYVNTQGAAGG